jgi:tetratricopeptide (TPR) repeat protein
MIAAEVSQPEWFRALDDLKKAYPGDSCVSLHSIGPLVAMKQYDKAIQAIEDLDKSVGGDPYLQIQRAEAYYAAGDIDKALDHAKKSTAMDKGMADGFWMQVTLSLKKKNFAETAKLLTHLEETFGVEIGDVGKIELYKEFSESPECKAWLESRKKK